MKNDETDTTNNLRGYRDAIDDIDGKVIELLNERARQSIAIAKIKHDEGLPVLSTQRENEIVARIAERNDGPHSDLQMVGYFASIIANSRQLQETAIDSLRQ